MPPQRTPLRSLLGNSIRGPNLTPYQRGKIAGAREAGDTPASISRCQNVPVSTIRYTLKLDKQRVEGVDLRRKPRGKSYSDIDSRHILRSVRNTPKATYAEVKLATGVTCSLWTIKRILADNGITNWMKPVCWDTREEFMSRMKSQYRRNWFTSITTLNSRDILVLRKQ